MCTNTHSKTHTHTHTCRFTPVGSSEAESGNMPGAGKQIPLHLSVDYIDVIPYNLIISSTARGPVHSDSNNATNSVKEKSRHIVKQGTQCNIQPEEGMWRSG